jgi:hypothetical protein
MACRNDAGRKPSGRAAADDANRSNRTRHGLISTTELPPIALGRTAMLHNTSMARHEADVEGFFPGAQ